MLNRWELTWYYVVIMYVSILDHLGVFWIWVLSYRVATMEEHAFGFIGLDDFSQRASPRKMLSSPGKNDITWLLFFCGVVGQFSDSSDCWLLFGCDQWDKLICLSDVLMYIKCVNICCEMQIQLCELLYMLADELMRWVVWSQNY